MEYTIEVSTIKIEVTLSNQTSNLVFDNQK